MIGGAASIDTNAGYGVNATVATTKITTQARTFSNSSGDYSANTGLYNPFDQSPSYTPAVSAISGSITSYASSGHATKIANSKIGHFSGEVTHHH
jgi:hypothetical protein